MQVTKRDGSLVDVDFNKVTLRLQKLAEERTPLDVDCVRVAKHVIGGLYDGVTTSQLDTLSAETAASMVGTHPDYQELAARVTISNLHKTTPSTFSEAVDILYCHTNPGTNDRAPLVSSEIYELSLIRGKIIEDCIDYTRDYKYDYFGIKTLERSYLLHSNSVVVERPQHMLMRVALGIHGWDLESAFETYEMMSLHLFTHASPTLFNSGTMVPQMSSCFLTEVSDDSIEGIYSTITDCALISKTAGGIGLSIHKVRGTGSPINGTNGESNGIVPMLQVFNATARYVDQGGGKRKGAIAIYLEPWHPDIFEFLDLRKNHGKEEARTRDLFLGLWTPDLFMRRVLEDGEWTLMSPDWATGLDEVFGEEFDRLYSSYEETGRGTVVKARDVWTAVISSQVETGTPYMLYKDHCNNKNNQSNLGTLKCSNLCTEILQYTSSEETAVCNLASVALPAFLQEDGSYCWDGLMNCVRVIVRNLNCIIDRNAYPTKAAENSNRRHRPIGIGVQGLADVFIRMKLPFDSSEAKLLNQQIFETIYYTSLWESCLIAKEEGVYQSYDGSPMSRGILQQDMWQETRSFCDWCDWDWLRYEILQNGLRNSLLVAPMPTASTSQILGNTECFEPITSNIYVRRTLAGEFTVVNKHLMRDLIDLGVWGESVKQELISKGGSVQTLDIPDILKRVYRTVWEISQKEVINMTRDRGAFVDQSQSMNIHLSSTDFSLVTSVHFHAWRCGLKTGMYYLRSRPSANPIQFTVEPEQKKPVDAVCDDLVCLSCGS